MGGRTILWLLFAVAGLGALLWFTDQAPKATEVAERSVLDGRALNECVRFGWQFAEYGPVEIARGDDGRLALVEPIADAVSPGYLKVICDAWNSARMRAVPFADDAAGRERAGLEPPAVRVFAVFPDGVRIDVDVGAAGPFGDTRFVRRDGVIWEAGAALYETLRVGIEDLRDRAVFRNSPPFTLSLRVETLSPTGKRETLRLERDGDEWRIRQPIETRADPGVAARFLAGVLSLRVDDFLPGVFRMPSRDPDIVIDVRGAQGEERATLWLERGQIYGMLPDRNSGFACGNQQYARIFEDIAQQLRARLLVPISSAYEDVAEIVIDPGQGRGERVRLQRGGLTEDWRLLEPVDYAANPTACNEALQAINNLQAVEFVDGAKAGDASTGLGPGRLQVSVRTHEKRDPTELWFGAVVEKQDLSLVHACRADEPSTVVLVPKIAVDHLRRDWTVYCSLNVLRVSVPVERLYVARRTGEPREFRSDGRHWILEGAEGARDDVGEFVNDVLRDLQAKRAVDVRGREFAVADWTASLRRASNDELAKVRVWVREGGQPLVVQAGEPGPVGFEVGDYLDKQLRALWD
jgi:hypothetical protein